MAPPPETRQPEVDDRGLDTAQLLRGVLDLAIVAVLAEEDGYGYEIVRRLREAGLEDVGDASVYGTLRRLFRSGALTSYVQPSDEGPHRKYYGLTSAGRDQLHNATKTWTQFRDTIDGLIESQGATR